MAEKRLADLNYNMIEYTNLTNLCDCHIYIVCSQHVRIVHIDFCRVHLVQL